MKRTDKRTHLVWVAVLASLAMAACHKEENAPADPLAVGGSLRISVASFQSHETKMEVEENAVAWTSGDEIYIGKTDMRTSTQQWYLDKDAVDPHEGFTLPIQLDADGNASVNYPYSIPHAWNTTDAVQSTIVGIINSMPRWYLLAYYPAGIIDGGGTDDDMYARVRFPGTYESRFTAEGKQELQLPMMGVAHVTHYANNPIHGLDFHHLTAALKVLVRNDTEYPLLVDRIRLTSPKYKLSGLGVADMTTYLKVYDEEETEAVKVSHKPADPATPEENSVELVLSEPLEVAPGAISLPIQVPMRPIGSNDGSIPNNLTVRVEARNRIPGALGQREVVFEYTVPGVGRIRRNEMKTMKIAMNPANTDRVSVTNTGAFSISAGQQVFFSKGNLKATTVDGWNSWTWSFMENQYDVVETPANMAGVGENYAGATAVSLFGWGTGGQPNRTTSDNSQYGWTEWGQNPVSNGGNSANYGWITMGYTEWQYLVSGRADAASKWGYAIVEDIRGVILLPDDWTLPDGCTFNPDLDGWFNGNISTNTYTATTWGAMEAAGAVFLPAAGERDSGSDNPIWACNLTGYYWTGNSDGDNCAFAITFGDQSAPTHIGQSQDRQRKYGHSVRLVRVAN